MIPGKVSYRQVILPLNVDFINENTVTANLVLQPQNSYLHISRFALYVLMECWTKAVYYYVN